MQAVRTIAAVLVAVLLGIVAYQQSEIISNQKAQMRQQFHSDGQVLWGVLGEDGLKKILSGSGELTTKESFAAGSLLHRAILIQKDISVAYTKEEKELAFVECRGMLHSSVMRDKWKQVRSWYAKDSLAIIDACVPE